MINNLSDLNGNELDDTMIEELWNEQVAENQVLREDIMAAQDYVKLRQILQAYDHYGKKSIIKGIQSIHSNLNQVYRNMANVMNINYDPKGDEYPDFIQVYSAVYSILRGLDEKFAHACATKSIKGSKIDFIMQHEEMRLKLIFIVRTLTVFFSSAAFRAVYTGLSRLLNEDRKRDSLNKMKGRNAYAKH